MIKRFSLVVFFIVLLLLPLWADSNVPKREELYRLKIENQAGGGIYVSLDQGRFWRQLGSVISAANLVDETGYAAAKWVSPGRVAATAVNAIHIKVGSRDTSRAVFSLLPKEFSSKSAAYKSYLSPASSIQTDLVAGSGIFGEGFAPFVGDSVEVYRQGKKIPIQPNFVPQTGDIFIIVVKQPVYYPREIVFDNRPGGQITVKYFSGEEKVLGQVVQPVSGIGRFAGSKYIGPGRIRANHAGVIDVSVSPLGSIGGFQIIPENHAADLAYVKTSSQWLVVGPAKDSQQPLAGQAPLFHYYIQPVFIPSDLSEGDWQSRLLARFLVEVKYRNSATWQAMPIFAIDEFDLERNLPDWATKALQDVTQIRILFPIGNN